MTTKEQNIGTKGEGERRNSRKKIYKLLGPPACMTLEMVQGK